MDPTTGAEKYEQTWRKISELVNGLPLEDRQQLRDSLGLFTHDIKHSLGLISSGNELIRRDFASCGHEHTSIEMPDVIQTGFEQINAYFDVIVSNLNNKIDV